VPKTQKGTEKALSHAGKAAEATQGGQKKPRGDIEHGVARKRSTIGPRRGANDKSGAIPRKKKKKLAGWSEPPMRMPRKKGCRESRQKTTPEKAKQTQKEPVVRTDWGGKKAPIKRATSQQFPERSPSNADGRPIKKKRCKGRKSQANLRTKMPREGFKESKKQGLGGGGLLTGRKVTTKEK